MLLHCIADSEWRNRDEFFRGRDAIKAFLTRKWQKELQYKLMKELWCYQGNRISVRFEYEYHDHEGQWWRAHGNEVCAVSDCICQAQHLLCDLCDLTEVCKRRLKYAKGLQHCKQLLLTQSERLHKVALFMQHWEFDDQGYMVRRDMSANDYKIQESERRYR